MNKITLRIVYVWLYLLIGCAVSIFVVAEKANAVTRTSLQNTLSFAPSGGIDISNKDGAELPLPAEQAFNFDAIVDDGNHLLLRFISRPGYYIYRDRISFAIEGASGIQPGLTQWPPGTSHYDSHFGSVTVYFDEVDIRLPLVRTRTDPSDITLVTTFQGCQNKGICYPPITRRIRLSLPKGKLSAPGQAIASPLVISTPAAPPPPTPTNLDAAQAKQTADASLNKASSEETNSPLLYLFTQLILAFVGGIILNFMPCVLPILSLKVLRLANNAHGTSRSKCLSACWYTLGILCSFLIIGSIAIFLRAAGQAAGWGFQLQQPVFVVCLIYLLFAIGLSLSGIFTLSAGWGRMGQSLASRHGPVGDFFSGVLSCVVASPCVAPFMGSAIAYAFTAPTYAALLVFVCLGLGLALPFLVIGFFPSLSERLPRPGPWMETFKNLLAFPMYLSTVWLLRVFAKQRGIDAMAVVLVGLICLTLGLWWFERNRWKSKNFAKWCGILCILAALIPLWQIAHSKYSVASGKPQNLLFDDSTNSVTYSRAMLDRLRADNRVIFVNITADWCVTCYANERSVFHTAAFQAALRDSDAVYMVGDWTNPNPEIESFLQSQHAVGVPLYIVYGPGIPPTTLPTILTEAVVEDALHRASR